MLGSAWAAWEGVEAHPVALDLADEPSGRMLRLLERLRLGGLGQATDGGVREQPGKQRRVVRDAGAGSIYLEVTSIWSLLKASTFTTAVEVSRRGSMML